jgi:hypothetical protein
MGRIVRAILASRDRAESAAVAVDSGFAAEANAGDDAVDAVRVERIPRVARH